MAEIEDREIPITFERKGKSDLWGTMTKGYPRFKKELERAKEFGLTVILLIEGSMRDIAKGFDRSQFSGDSMLKKLAMLRVRYDLEYHFFNDRYEMSRFIEEIFSACERNFVPLPKENNLES